MLPLSQRWNHTFEHVEQLSGTEFKRRSIGAKSTGPLQLNAKPRFSVVTGPRTPYKRLYVTRRRRRFFELQRFEQTLFGSRLIKSNEDNLRGREIQQRIGGWLGSACKERMCKVGQSYNLYWKIIGLNWITLIPRKQVARIDIVFNVLGLNSII
ncbi:hypothetical protein M7I_3860 [Glarea lozoyensis 74030]|uniref:Uncharacterized protein n=1 Tax=Glarea lozoyensis (strain ATCC 74030 / MF5533) TaxID=1104152 RepID=H0EMM1_GLAL7|nr:hypothetical protein M7I_3860 [Glarea lozoyensis 74030]